MMVPPPLTWMHLFPADVSFCNVGSPTWFQEMAEVRRAGRSRSALVVWGHSPQDFPALDSFDGVVAVNCRGLSAQRLRAAGFTYVRHFAVLPSLAEARWFIPLDSPVMSSGAFCLYAPFRGSARLKHLGVRAAARSGLPFWYRDQVWIAQRATPPVEDALGAVGDGSPIRLAFTTGSPGPLVRRKPSLAVLGKTGHPLAFAKLAASPVSERLLRHEAEILRMLASRSRPSPPVPRVLFDGEVDGRYLLVQSPVSGRSTRPEWSIAHRRYLDSLQAREPKLALATAVVGSLRSQVAAASSASQADLPAVLHRAEAALEGLFLPTTVVHGDFAPWNLRQDHGNIVAFDWEHAELDGLPLLDELHHRLVVGHLFEGWTAVRGAECVDDLAYSAPSGLRPEHVRGLASIYLLTFLIRLSHHGHDDQHEMFSWYHQVLDQVDEKLKEPVAA